MMSQYSESGLELLRYAILKQANEDYYYYNRKSRTSMRKAELKQSERWKDKGIGYANEMIRVLIFVLSGWYKVLTKGQSPQVSIYNKLLSQCNEYVKEYVENGVKEYAKRKNIQIAKGD